jgi:hypothetical protein
MKGIVAVIAGFIIAMSVSFYLHSDGFDNFRFNVGLYDKEAEHRDIEKTIKLFNRYFATFFNTGGNLEGLDIIPAANLVKRRIVQEINQWRTENKVLTYDKDDFELEHIELLGPREAVAVAREVWFLNVQEFGTRKKLKGIKANPIRVRYILVKYKGDWKIEEYEVFHVDDEVPPFRDRRI